MCYIMNVLHIQKCEKIIFDTDDIKSLKNDLTRSIVNCSTLLYIVLFI